MTTSDKWTVRNLRAIEDAAAQHGHGAVQEARFANRELATTGTGLSLQRVKPNCASAFAHRHENAEEVYVVLGGSGHAVLDGESVELGPLDALRVAPSVVRSFASTFRATTCRTAAARRRRTAGSTACRAPRRCAATGPSAFPRPSAQSSRCCS